MRVTSEYIRNELAKLWPDLDMAILVDTDFILSKVDQIIKIFNESKVHERPIIPQFNDCDNSALRFHVELRDKQYEMFERGELKPDELFPWATSIAIVTQARGIEAPHVVNLTVCEEGIYIFDKYPDSNRYWKASSKMDNPVILFM